MFTLNSYAIIYGLQTAAAQHMLDFDFLCGRTPSVLAFITHGKKTSQKLFFGDSEIHIPSFSSFQDIPQYIQEKVDTCINFASFRSSYEVTIQAMESTMFKSIIIIAEGIPERQTLQIIEKNKNLGIHIIGPATVGAMYAGVFRVGNTGGSLENIIASKLYRPGNVGFISKSGGMSNEMRKVIADNTSGTSLSLALGGDAYNILDFQTSIQILEKDPNVDMIVLLGEIGGRDEILVGDMITEKIISKPVVAWCIGTINEHLSGEVQFGHAGAKSNKEEETASYKNEYLRKSGAYVPKNFMVFGELIAEVYQTLPQRNIINLDIGEKLEKIQNRKKTLFTSTISDERGEELLYNGKKISEFTQNPDIGRVIGHLWLKRELPQYATHFINTVIILIADHGPAVSGAQNAIITSRSGNDLKSSLIAGLATVGPLFGGAIDGAGKYWLNSIKNGLSPEEFVEKMKRSGKNIPGIGHKIKSKLNPDIRCKILEQIAQGFPSSQYLDFAKSVESLTLEKKSNLILNVDGFIAAMLLDIFEDLGMDDTEKEMYIDAGIFNGLFLLSRTIGFIGHSIDQKRLGEGLYRSSWDDISYQ